ncbi:DUF3887 domain-containing protein [Spirosoma sp. KCTC 42546]|uniref:DUF3887 domain-containing protein n=1 Tax=Spirosoma sp. KCTC 42546 TaxID=2520506 RepID=UPI00115A4D5E|nr:DUF3887 domain-containing protein [Spirosoma sp. KCTC 42546]QDK77730.1 DUF3887 domain-containing protein [Spirosoma sp. KCTC 42546]
MKINSLHIISFALLLLPTHRLESSSNQIDNVIIRRSIDESSRMVIAQKIIDNLAKEKFEAVRADFAGVLKQQLSPQNIKDVWLSTTAQLGRFEKVVATRTAVIQGYNQVISRCKFESDVINIEVTFNEDDKVFGLFLKP